MSVTERERFLADLHVGVFSIERSDGPPLTVPVWYSYEPGGEVVVVLDPDSVKGRLLQQAGRFSLCVQSEDPPYKYVSVEGRATLSRSDLDRDLRPMARRYLGDEFGDRFAESGMGMASAARAAMTPERWFTADYAKQGW
jgi:PPOX class probable F420-dependent enzyme